MNTSTQTHTRTKIREVFESFEADLRMLAWRTQAMEITEVKKYADDILLMAQKKCLKNVHIQLRSCYGELLRVHEYSVKEGLLASSQRPGGNRWPRLPDGKLHVIVTLSDNLKWEDIKSSGQFKIPWSSSDLSTNYSGMYKESNRLYSSNGYGLQRDTFVNL